MKKIVFAFFILLFLCFSVSAREWKRQYWEAGIFAEAGVSNTLFTLEELFFGDGTLDIDINDLSGKDVKAAMNGRAEAFINFPLIPVVSLGGFIGTDLAVGGNISGRLFELLSNSYQGTIDGTAGFGGSLFFDMGLRGSGTYKKIIFSVSPAFYFPFIFLPWSESNIQGDKNNSVYDLRSRVNIYSMGPMDDNGSIRVNGSDFFKAAGFDISLTAAYPLFSFLEVGGGIEHIPVIPARLSHEKFLDYNYRLDTSVDGLNGDFNVDDMTPELASSSDASFFAFRPLRFDFFAVYKPLKSGLAVIRPNIGFSCLTIFGYDKACFNAGLEGTVFLWGVFSASLGSEYKERLWRQKLTLGLNLRVVELNLGINLEAPDFADSFRGKGMGFLLGISVGY